MRRPSMSISEELKRKMRETIDQMATQDLKTMPIPGMDYYVVSVDHLEKGMFIFKEYRGDTPYHLYHIINHD